MKKTRIFSIGLALMLVVGVIAAAVPSAAAPPGNTEWIQQSAPSTFVGGVMELNGDMSEFSQSNDGHVWFVDAAGAKTAAAIIQTSTSGTTWSAIVGPTGVNMTNIAVAPDNSNVVAVADNNTNKFYVSSDGGVTWMELTGVPTGNAGRIMDIAVSPARSTAVLGREYAIAMADTRNNNSTCGGLFMIGSTTSWTKVATTNSTNRADFVRVEFSPGYAGDRVLVGLGVNTTVAKTKLYLINTAQDAHLSFSPVTVYDTATALGDVGVTGSGGAAISYGDIALPSDFDATSAATMRCYVSIGSNAASARDGVYRMSAYSGADLNETGTAAANSVDSIGYAGTSAEGTLFCGYISAGAVVVTRTTNPTATSPTWIPASTAPTGSTYVQVRPKVDFATSNTVFASTRGAESAWNISDDGGVSFHQRSWIDNGAANDWREVEGMAVSADGASMFLVTDDGADLHVWYTPVPPSSMSSKRMYNLLTKGDANGSISMIALNPDWETSPTIYIVDASQSPDDIYVSHNAGATWAKRIAPGDIEQILVVDAQTIYVTDSNKFYKSTNAGWIWEAAIAWYPTAKDASDIKMAPDGAILIAGPSAVRKSTDGGATWASVGVYDAHAVNQTILADANYADNGIVYAANSVAGGAASVKRIEPGDSYWRAINNGTRTGRTLELYQVDGALYQVTSNQTDRNLSPTIAVAYALFGWASLDNGAIPNGGSDAAMVGNTIYVNDNVDDISAYIDSAATLKPVITAPASGTEIAINPNNGQGIPFTIVLQAIGEGQGAINRWDYKVYEKAAGSGTAITIDDMTGTAKLTSALNDGVDQWPTMLPNQTYIFQVRGNRTVSGETLETPWSDAVEVTVQSGTQVTQTYAGPQIIGPAGGDTTNLKPGFAWAPVAGATEYQFILATDAALTKTIGGTPVTVTQPSFQASGLDYGTTYFWAVKVTAPTPGPQTIGTFTTMEEPVEVTPTTAPPATTVAPPVVNVPTQAPPEITVEVPPATSAIPAVAIWVVIGVGAVLVIAVLVLIVRTRRPV